MELRVILFLGVVLLVGFVVAQDDDWDDFVDGNVSVNDSVDDRPEIVEEVEDFGDSSSDGGLTSSEGLAKRVYTENFYLALGALGVAVLIISYLAYAFFRKPKNKW